MTPPRPERLRDTYRAECVCGATVESHEREAVCHHCGRHLIYEWGRPPLVVSDAEWRAHQERQR